MQRLKAVVQGKHSIQKLGVLSQQRRSYLAQPSYSTPNDDIRNQVLVEGRTISRTAILNRPSSLNALTTSMVARLKKLYESWEETPDIEIVMMKGSGRAFCAGADVVQLYQSINEGTPEECRTFFDTLNRFVYLMGTYLKPNVSVMGGITIAGGAGISLSGMYRLVTDRTVFSHPETQMGFHPDAGASFYLSRLPGYLGEFLALTGEKLTGAEMIACGLATHYSLNARLALIEERLANLTTDSTTVIESSLAQYGDVVYPDRRSVLHKLESIDKCFSHDSVEEIVNALQKDVAETQDEWCTIALQKLQDASPLSLKVTLQSIRDGRFQTLDKCLVREHRISLTYMSKTVSSDFCEGVRSRLVDKDFSPKWDPPSLKDVSKDMVDSFFSPLSEPDSELVLPTALREPNM